jgi:hypothetical protein
MIGFITQELIPKSYAMPKIPMHRDECITDFSLEAKGIPEVSLLLSLSSFGKGEF